MDVGDFWKLFGVEKTGIFKKIDRTKIHSIMAQILIFIRNFIMD